MKPSQSQARIHVVEKVVGRSAISGSTATARWKIDNPSIRLHLTVHCFARPSNTGTPGSGGSAHIYTGETWQLYSVADGSPQVRTNAVFTDPTTGLAAAVQLPDTYEGETGVKVIDGEASLVANDNGADDYVVQCIWEPAAGGLRLTDLEWADLVAQCELTVSKVVTVG